MSSSLLFVDMLLRVTRATIKGAPFFFFLRHLNCGSSKTSPKKWFGEKIKPLQQYPKTGLAKKNKTSTAVVPDRRKKTDGKERYTTIITFFFSFVFPAILGQKAPLFRKQTSQKVLSLYRSLRCVFDQGYGRGVTPIFHSRVKAKKGYTSRSRLR